jgi:hypothetical protein
VGDRAAAQKYDSSELDCTLAEPAARMMHLWPRFRAVPRDVPSPKIVAQKER